MKSAVLLFSAILYISVRCEEETYTSKFDNIDLDEIFRSERLLSNYMDCFMDKGNCTPQGDEVRKHLPDAIKTECGKCTEKQKANAKKTLKFLANEKPEMYKELEKKYDPEGKYKEKAEKFRNS